VGGGVREGVAVGSGVAVAVGGRVGEGVSVGGSVSKIGAAVGAAQPASSTVRSRHRTRSLIFAIRVSLNRLWIEVEYIDHTRNSQPRTEKEGQENLKTDFDGEPDGESSGLAVHAIFITLRM